MIRVAVADDHIFVREALRLFIGGFPGLKFVGEACDGAGAVGLAESGGVDVLVLDVSTRRMGGLQTLEQLRLLAPQVKVVVLSAEFSWLPGDEVKKGSTAFVQKGGHPQELADAICGAVKVTRPTS